MLIHFDGEEFLIVLTETTLDGASLFAELIRQEIEPTRFSTTSPRSVLPVTVSTGVAAYHINKTTPSRLIERVYSGLNQAKKQGRKRVCMNP